MTDIDRLCVRVKGTAKGIGGGELKVLGNDISRNPG